MGFIVDIDKARETAMRYGIMSVPTIMFFKGGEVRESLVGFRTKAALEDHISRVLA